MELTGECNRCGLCCTLVRGGRRFWCADLMVAGDLGQPGASWCRVYERRVDGMGIRMIAEDGGAGLEARCGCGGSLDETLAILPHIGRGCSLTVR